MTSQDDGFILDTLRDVKPMEIVMHQLRQAAVELPGTCQNAGRHIHYTWQFVGDDLQRPGKNDITVIHTWRNRGVDKCRRRLHGEHPPDMLKLAKMVEASHTDIGDMLYKAEIGRDDNSKHSGVLLRCDNIHCKLQRWKGKVLQQTSRTSPEQLGLIDVQLQSITSHPLVNVLNAVFESDDSRCCIVVTAMQI